MGTKVKLCLIGTGRAGMIHAENFCTNVKDAEMIAVSDVDEQRAQEAARELGIASWYTDYREAIKESGADAVIIATPTKFHCDIAVCAAENGLHIFCEKPMAMSVPECEKMIRAADKNKVMLLCQGKRNCRFRGDWRSGNDQIPYQRAQYSPRMDV